MTMHVPKHTDRPACWTTEVKPTALWSYDQGASCGCARTRDEWRRVLELTPGCNFCARAVRALSIAEGLCHPHPPIRTAKEAA